MTATRGPPRRRSVKCGEMIAFRRRSKGLDIVTAIPVDSAVDEVSIQGQVHAAGFRSVYEPAAVVTNWGPEKLSDWFVQRRRINAGHIASARWDGYRPATMNTRRIMSALRADPLARTHKVWLLGVIALEAMARARGRVDVMRGREHRVWKIATTTKRPIEQESIR